MLTTNTETPAYAGLIRTIGIPGILKGSDGKRDPSLMQLAQLNKIALLYSAAIDDPNYKVLFSRHEVLMDTLKQLSTIFNLNEIKYSIFKTIKPFLTTPSDVDVLLSSEDFENAEALLLSLGYKRITRDAYSSTLEKGMIVDLQLQPSVSNLPYLSKRFLLQNTILKNMNGFNVRTLNIEAEAIVIAAHSFYKEQMFTLNDYYTMTLLAEQLDIEKLVSMAETTQMTAVLDIIIGVCAQITESAFNTTLRINQISQRLGSSKWPLSDDLPMKFPFGLVFRLLISRISKDKDMRRMMIPALLRLGSPRQIAKLISHIRRETY